MILQYDYSTWENLNKAENCLSKSSLNINEEFFFTVETNEIEKSLNVEDQINLSTISYNNSLKDDCINLDTFLEMDSIEKDVFYVETNSEPQESNFNLVLEFNSKSIKFSNCLNLWLNNKLESVNLFENIDYDEDFINGQIFQLVLEKFNEIIFHPSGNVFMQIFLEKVNEDNKYILAGVFAKEIEKVGKDKNSVKVAQVLIDEIKNNSHLFVLFLEKIFSIIPNLMVDLSGKFLVMKLISVIKSPDNNFLLNLLIENFNYFATNKNSIIVISFFIDNSNDFQRMLLIKRIMADFNKLVVDPSGIYLIEHLIMQGDCNINFIIVSRILKDALFLCKNKYSSTIVEACLKYNQENTRAMLIKEMSDTKFIIELMVDMYGNYVLQKALVFANEFYRNCILTCIAYNVDRLKTVNFGKQLSKNLQKNYPQFKQMIKRNNINNQVNNVYMNNRQNCKFEEHC